MMRCTEKSSSEQQGTQSEASKAESSSVIVRNSDIRRKKSIAVSEGEAKDHLCFNAVF